MMNVQLSLIFMGSEGEEDEDTISYYGPVPDVDDGVSIEEDICRAPGGIYVVTRRVLHMPMLVWEILAQRLDDFSTPEQTADDSHGGGSE